MKKLMPVVLAAALTVAVGCTGDGPGVAATTWPNPPRSQPSPTPTSTGLELGVTSTKEEEPEFSTTASPSITSSSPSITPSIQSSPSGTELPPVSTSVNESGDGDAAWAVFRTYEEVLRQALSDPTQEWGPRLQEVSAGNVYLEDSGSIDAMYKAGMRQTGFAQYDFIGLQDSSTDSVKTVRACADFEPISGVSSDGSSAELPARTLSAFADITVEKFPDSRWRVTKIELGGPCE